MDEGLPIESTEPSKRAVKCGRITLCLVGLICLLVAGTFAYLNPHRQVLLASCVLGVGIVLVWLGIALPPRLAANFGFWLPLFLPGD